MTIVPPTVQMLMIARLGLIQFGSVVQNGPGMPMSSSAAVDDPGRAVEEDEDHDPDRDRRRDVGEVEDGAEEAGARTRAAPGSARAPSATTIFAGTVITV